MSNTGVEYQLSLKDLFTSKVKKATNETERLNKAMSGATNLASAFGVGIGVAGIVSFGKSVVDSLVNYEYFSASLRTLMKGDEKAAKSLQSQLVTLASTSPFSLVEVQDATKQLLAYGFAAGDVTKNISMLGDVASGLKIPFSDIAYLYGTLKTQGRAYARDIMQFTQRGIPIVKELAKQFGVTESKVMELVSAGKVGFPQIEKAFQSLTTEGGQFFGMMESQSKTVGGQISNLGDNWEQLKVNIGKSQTGIIAGTVSFFNSMVGEFTSYFSQTNKMNEALSKFGGKAFGFFDSYAESKAYKELAVYDEFVKKSETSLTNAIIVKGQLYKALMSLYDSYKSGKIGIDEFGRRKAMIKSSIAAAEGNVSLFKQKGVVEKTTGAASAGSSLDAVEAKGHQNFNIDIQNLIENLSFQTTNLKDSAAEIKAQVTKAMISAVNDFQLMATK